MKNNILLYGEKDLVNQEAKKIVDSVKVNSESISYYDLEQDSIYKVIEDACTMNLFQDKKIIMVNNFSCFFKLDDGELEKYLNNYNKNTYLILMTDDKVDSRKKIVKLLDKIGLVKELGKPLKYQIDDYIKNYLSDYQISRIDLEHLISLLGTNINNINNELDKLMIYKVHNKEITRQDIVSLIVPVLDENIFALVDSVTGKNLGKSIRLYNDLKVKGEDDMKILIMIANKFRLIYQVKKYYEMGKSKDEMASILKVHPYPVSLALNLAYQYSYQNLVNILLDSAKIDAGIKTGKINKKVALEVFITKICSM